MAKKVSTMGEFKKVCADAEDKVVVAYFTATWCKACEVTAPYFQKKVQELSEDMIFIKVDVDDCDDLLQELNIMEIPKFLFYQKEKKIDETCGNNVGILEHCFAKCQKGKP